MRVVFLGTPDFAVPALQTLINSSYKVVAVFCQPDRPVGRGQSVQAPPVKLRAKGAGIPVFQPEKIRSIENQAIFRGLQPDFLVVAAYGQILPGWLLASARIAPVNIHGSLLPFYRGAAPVIWALLNGEKRTGVTTMFMEETLDTGPILLQQDVSIPDDMTQGELSTQLARAGAELLLPTLDGLRNQTLSPVPQDNEKASWAPRITKDMSPVSWDASARDIHNKIRAFNPWPVAHLTFRDQRVQLYQSTVGPDIEDSGNPPGTFLGCTGGGLLVQCGGGTSIEVTEVQPASRKRMSGREFASGYRLRPKELLIQIDR